MPRWLLYRYWVIQHLYAQQWQMYCDKSRRCDDRIVSISQPYVRPIVRGKQSKPVEFGAKLSVSLNGQGLARVDYLRWDAFHEGLDLQSQVEDYRRRYRYYPQKVLADPIYWHPCQSALSQEQRHPFCRQTTVGRPNKVTAESNRQELQRLKAQRREDYRQRISD